MNLAAPAAFCCAVALAWTANPGTPAPPRDFSEIAEQATKSAEDINWVRYTDSAEGAFSMDVPLGWQVQGGMYRFGYFDVRWMMDVRSLDGKIIIRIDDVNIPPYALPGVHTGRDGQPYSKPQQFQMMVSSYREGQPYAEMYAKHRFADVCKSMNPVKGDWSPTLPATWQISGAMRTTEGGAAYECSTSDGPRIATVYARTTLYGGNANFWVVDPVISIIATPDGTPLAHSIIQHMIESWEKNPQWANYQNRVTQMGLQQIQAGFRQFMQQMQAYHEQRTAAMNQQVASFQSRQDAQARQVSNWGDILTGVQKVSDPQTGREFQVFSGPKANYYTNGTGITINSNVSPGANFRQVNPVQP
jgi:hypothetical protein